MSEQRTGYVVVGKHRDPDQGERVIGIFVDEKSAQRHCLTLSDYNCRRPETPEPQDEPNPLATLSAIETQRAWSDAHPGGHWAASCYAYKIIPAPFLDEKIHITGFANAWAMTQFQAGQSTSVEVVRDKETVWRTAEQDGEPVAVYTREALPPVQGVLDGLYEN